jgi:ADP-ribosylation factor related protein 1
MIDSTDNERLEESWTAFDKMIQNEQLIGLPLLVACNKQDLSNCMTVPDIKKKFNKSAAKIGKKIKEVFDSDFYYSTLFYLIRN